MSITTRVSNAWLVLQNKDVPQRPEKISDQDFLIFVIGSTGSGKSTYAPNVQFINTALGKKPMVASEPSGLVSCTKSIQTFKCTSPWNPLGRSVIFVDIPAFNHSTLDIQKRVPDLITAWLETHCTNKSVDSGILYLHAMSPRLNEGFDKHFVPFVKLCHKKNHKPISALLVTTMWFNHGISEESERKKVHLEDHFKLTRADIRKIPTSMNFDNGKVESACAVLNALLEDIIVAKYEGQSNVEKGDFYDFLGPTIVR